MNPTPTVRRPPALISRRRRSIERVSLLLARHSRGRRHGLWIGLLVAIAVHLVVTEARTAQGQWGGRTPVAVATVAIEPGDPIDGADIHVRDVPLILLPDRPVLDIPLGAVAAVPIPAGQILTESALAGDREGIRSGERAVTIPLPLAPPELVIGDLVDVYAVRADSLGGASVVPVALRATVARLPDDGITLAVPAGAVPTLWEALATGSVEVARRPPQG